MGFLGAGYLIHSSYSAWQASPVTTTIETKPIADLDFPMVTVCPPKGSHTALNYDLMKAENNSLAMEDRDRLKNETYKLFIEPSHKEYVKLLMAVANSENIKQTFDGFQSVPRPDAANRGFDIKMWNNNGTWHTPWFGEEHDATYYEKDQYYNILLELPTQVGSESLKIQLEVNTREEKGWQEEVMYWEGSKYKLYTRNKRASGSG